MHYGKRDVDCRHVARDKRAGRVSTCFYEGEHLENAFRRIKRTVKASARDYSARGTTWGELFEIRRGSAPESVRALKKQPCEQTARGNDQVEPALTNDRPGEG